MADDAPRTAPTDASLKPHRFTWDEVCALSAAEVFGPTTRVELIGGELYPLPEEGFLHVDCVGALQDWLTAACAAVGLRLSIRDPLHLPDGSVVIPDLAVYAAGTRARDMTAANARLVIEVADTTLARDATLKLPRYRAAGVAEVWIVEARARLVHVHVADQPDRARGPGEPVAPAFASIAFDPALLPES